MVEIYSLGTESLFSISNSESEVSLNPVSELYRKIISSEEFFSETSIPPRSVKPPLNARMKITFNSSLERNDLHLDLQEIILKICGLIEKYRGQAEFKMELEPINAILNQYANVVENGVFELPPEILNLVSLGISGTYFLLNREEMALVVIKPLDEDYGCINNPKKWNTLLKYSPEHAYIPLYQAAQKEALTYQFARALSVESIAPKTALAILRSEKFFDFRDHPERTLPAGLKDPKCLEECNALPREKLCSVQEFIQKSETLLESYERTVKQFNEKQFEELNQRMIEQFDQQQFEDLNILIWAIYDTDAHPENILTFVLRYDKNGQEIYGLKKIDNALTFPEKNQGLQNALIHLPNVNKPLSSEGIQKLAAADVEALSEQMKKYGLETAIPAFRERMALLKELILEPNITIAQVNQRLENLSKECVNAKFFYSNNYAANDADQP